LEEFVPAIFPEPPADPVAAAKYRRMLAIVIILGVLIMLAVGVIGAKIVTTSSTTKTEITSSEAVAAPAKTPAKPKAVSMSLAPGYKILNSETQPGRLILHVRSDSQDEIDIIDLDDGRVVARIHATAPE
jgi:hypothetical protein